MKRVGVVSLLALALACSATGSTTKVPPPSAKQVADPAPLAGARWVLTDRAGVMFDEAGSNKRLGGVELAIVNGTRVVVDAGVVKRSARFGDKLAGFRSIPERLGGGFVFWSDARTYRASEFLGELKAIADVGATGGVRPWLDRLLLRTPRGLLEVDAKTGTVTRARLPGVADALAIDAKRAARIDVFGRATVTTDGGATWVDLLARFGAMATGMSVADEDDLRVGAYRITRDGKVERSPTVSSAIRNGPAYEAKSITAVFPWSRSLASEVAGQAIAAGAFFAPSARTAGGVSPGRLLVTREQGVRVLTTETLLPLQDADYQGLDERFQHCQAVNLGEDVALACALESGAALLSIETTPGAPKLEATFPEAGAFVVGAHGRFGFAGRCGPEAPSGLDLGGPKPQGPAPYEEDPSMYGGGPPPWMPPGVDTDSAPPPPPPPEEEPKPSTDVARFCVRVRAGLWMERKLTGDDAKALYRWLPSADGTAVALVLGKGEGSADKPPDAPHDEPESPEPEHEKDEEPLRAPHGGKIGPKGKPGAPASSATASPYAPPSPPVPSSSPRAPEAPSAKPASSATPTATNREKGASDKADKPPEGVRVIHLDPLDPALAGAAFPPLLPTSSSAPWRSVENDFWVEDGGGVRGWIQLPGNDDPKEPPQPVQVGARTLRVSSTRGGRLAGARIADDGKVTILPLPDGTTHVVTGGRFAIATARKDDAKSFFESTDGGATWTEIEGPPAGDLEGPMGDDVGSYGCSAAGCSFGNGIVRLGWGGAKPSGPVESKLPAASGPTPKETSPVKLRCAIDDAAVLDEKPAAKPTDRKKPPPAPPKPKPLPPKPPPAKAPSASPKGKPLPSKIAPAKPLKKPDDKGKPKPPPPTTATPPPGPISLFADASSGLGELKDHTFKTEVLAPFDPSAAPKKLSINDKTLSTNVGSVLPLLGDKGAIDLLLLVDKHRARAIAGPSSFLAFEPTTRFTDAIEGPGGALLAIDANGGAIFLTRGEASSQAMSVTRVFESARKTLTLARGPTGAIEIVAYATSNGEVVAGELDVGRAEVGPLVSLGSLATLADGGASPCRANEPAHLALLEVPMVLTLEDKSGKAIVDGTTTTVLALVSGRADKLCVLGIEARLARAHAVLSARFDKPAAAVRTPTGKGTRASCSMK